MSLVHKTISLTGPTKLSGNESCEIGGSPGAKHVSWSQILETEFLDNLRRLRLITFLLLAETDT